MLWYTGSWTNSCSRAISWRLEYMACR